MTQQPKWEKLFQYNGNVSVSPDTGADPQMVGLSDKLEASQVSNKKKSICALMNLEPIFVSLCTEQISRPLKGSAYPEGREGSPLAYTGNL